MFDYRKLPANVIKYLIIWSIIFGLIIFIPYNKLGVKDSIILAIILTLTVIIIENITVIITKEDTEKFDGSVVSPLSNTSTLQSSDTVSQISQNSVSSVSGSSTTSQQQITPPTTTQPVSQQSASTVVSSQQQPSSATATSTQQPSNTTVQSSQQGIQPLTNTTLQSSTQSTTVQQTAQPTTTQPIAQQQTSTQQSTSQQPSDTQQKTSNAGSTLYAGQPNSADKEVNGSRAEDGVNMTDMPYTDYNHIPLGDTYKPADFEYGYSFLPPEKWYPTPPFPPVCVSEKRCSVCPMFTTGTPVDVKEWNDSRKITPPAGINVKYIKDTLNAGR